MFVFERRPVGPKPGHTDSPALVFTLGLGGERLGERISGCRLDQAGSTAQLSNQPTDSKSAGENIWFLLISALRKEESEQKSCTSSFKNGEIIQTMPFGFVHKLSLTRDAN